MKKKRKVLNKARKRRRTYQCVKKNGDKRRDRRNIREM